MSKIVKFQYKLGPILKEFENILLPGNDALFKIFKDLCVLYKDEQLEKEIVLVENITRSNPNLLLDLYESISALEAVSYTHLTLPTILLV